MKKLLSIILSLAMVLTCLCGLSVSAYADDQTTTEDPTVYAEVTENVPASLYNDEIHMYTFTPSQDGIYTFSVTGWEDRDDTGSVLIIGYKKSDLTGDVNLFSYPIYVSVYVTNDNKNLVPSVIKGNSAKLTAGTEYAFAAYAASGNDTPDGFTLTISYAKDQTDTATNVSTGSLYASDNGSSVYNGKVKDTGFGTQLKDGTLIMDGCYTSIRNGSDPFEEAELKNVGKYFVTLSYDGIYSGTVTGVYTIKPKATTLSSVTALKNGFTAKINAQKTQTTGYELQYTGNGTTKNIYVGNSVTSKTVKSLKSGKKYKVRVRTYKTVKYYGVSMKIYSTWSAYKTVTVK